MTCRSSFLVLLAPAVAHTAEPPPIVAVFDIDTEIKSKRSLAQRLTDQLRVELATSKRMVIIDKGEQETQLRKLLEEQQRASYKECVDEACQIPLGKELAANQILRTRLVKFGESYLLSSELVDVKTGASAGGASVETDGSARGLLEGVKRLARRLTGTAPLEGGSGETVRLGAAAAANVQSIGGALGGEDGIVRIETLPAGATVWIDGEKLAGRTPLEDFLRLGKRKVRVEEQQAHGRYKPHEAEVVLKAGMTLKIRLEETTGEIVVVARDETGRLIRNVPISLDGKQVAKAPVRLKGIGFGKHELLLRTEHGSETRRQFVVASPEPQRIQVIVLSKDAGAKGKLCDLPAILCFAKTMAVELDPTNSPTCEDATMYGFDDWQPVSRAERSDYCIRSLAGATSRKISQRAYRQCLKTKRYCRRDNDLTAPTAESRSVYRPE